MQQDFKVGFIAPLSAPGWRDAGEQLVSGFRRGVTEINSRGGVNGRMIVPLIRDTAGHPGLASELVGSLKRAGVHAIAGEYHSVVARSVAQRAHELELPYLCSSAVLDKLINQPSNWIARLAPPQSKGWSRYADYLSTQGHTRVTALFSDSLYWRRGMEILRHQLSQQGGTLTGIEYQESDLGEMGSNLVSQGSSCLLLLLGHPQPITSVVRAVRSGSAASRLAIGTPAGQSELALWQDELGPLGLEVPFLQYLPETLTDLGLQVSRSHQARCDTPLSFVALEGFDSAQVVASLLRDRRDASPWSSVVTDGTRGRISFSFDPGCNIWQWMTAPVRVATVVSSRRGGREIRALTKAVV